MCPAGIESEDNAVFETITIATTNTYKDIQSKKTIDSREKLSYISVTSNIYGRAVHISILDSDFLSETEFRFHYNIKY